MSEQLGDDDINWNYHWQEVQKDITPASIVEFEWFKDLLPQHVGCILEIGCGPARYSTPWIEIGGNYYGLDFSHEAITKAKQRSPESVFVESDNSDIKAFGTTFDVIFTNTHLQHVNNSKKPIIFREAHRYLNEGGLFIMQYEKEDVESKTTMLFPNLQVMMETCGFKNLRHVEGGNSVWQKV